MGMPVNFNPNQTQNKGRLKEDCVVFSALVEMTPKYLSFYANEETGTTANDMVCSTLRDKYLSRWEQHVIREGAGQAAKVRPLQRFNWSKAGLQNPWWQVDNLKKKLKKKTKNLSCLKSDLIV